MNKTLSVIIPAKNEPFLKKTIEDVLNKAEEEVEVLPVLDGYTLHEGQMVHDPRVHYLHMPSTREMKKRQCVNLAASVAQGDYLMTIDAHVLLGQGFDRIMKEDHESGCVQTLRRERLDPENWCVIEDGRLPVDYEYIMWPGKFRYQELHGFKWDSRTLERKDVLKDDICEFQGSLWFLEKDFFKEMGFMNFERFGGFVGEPEELVLSAYRAGGRAFVNKRTYDAHLHKGQKYGRGYYRSKHETDEDYKNGYNYWVHENKDFFVNFIKKFMPLPGWPSDWESRIYNH